MGPPDKRTGPEGPARVAAAKQANAKIIADRQRQARGRVQAQDRHRRICRMADELMPMAVYYGPRPLRSIPLGQFLVEGWWAA
jgi:hypothetical protein